MRPADRPPARRAPPRRSTAAAIQVLLLAASGCGGCEQPADPAGPSVSDHGVTWVFSAPVTSGRYVTGDPWIVCPARVVAISPVPGGGRNGSVRNVPPVLDRTAFDDRTEGNRYDPALGVTPPIDLVPGDSLVSSISVTTPGLVENCLSEGNGERSLSPVKSVSVLTCVPEPPPADAFRPSYAGHPRRGYRLGDVNRALLPKLAPHSAFDAATLRAFADRLQRPWVDNLFYAFDAQVDTMPMYGRETGRVAGIASLLLMLDLPPGLRADQERLLVGFLQHGIDLWGLVEAGHPGWYAHGGHGSGRKWPIVFAGLLLGDAAMASPTVTHPGVRFGEDLHTAFASALPYGPAWNGAAVVYTGHMGWWDGAPVSSTPGWGPYEHLAPERWESARGESYRRCCTSLAWVGQGLAARLMGAEASWNHPPFFSYVDRWMDPTGDASATQAIFDRTGWDFRASWAAQGQAWDSLVEEMWAAYR
jgi:hypothetical protein